MALTWSIDYRADVRGHAFYLLVVTAWTMWFNVQEDGILSTVNLVAERS